jgi:hypothetical protein
MKPINFFIYLIILCGLSLISCSDYITDPVPENQDKLLLHFPEVSSPGVVTTVHAVIEGATNQQTIVTWYADNFNFPQSVREQDIVNTPATASFSFEFPYLPDQAYYYVRCSAISADGNIFEKTAKIQLIK